MKEPLLTLETCKIQCAHLDRRYHGGYWAESGSARIAFALALGNADPVCFVRFSQRQRLATLECRGRFATEP